MRSTFLAYSLPWITEAEIAEVADSLRSGWVTTGPKTKRFEQDFASHAGAAHAIAVSSCTAGLHLILSALGVAPGDEVIVPTLTFCATANVVAHLGARPVLVDVDSHGLIDPEAVERAISPQTKAIIPVHYAGQACDLDRLEALAAPLGIPLVEDAAHAAGSEYKGRRIGTHGKAAAFSFYATKNMTTGEGGMITTQDPALALHLRRLSLHGMSRDAWKRYSESGSWFYEVLEPGFKCNMTDIQSSLGIHQLRRLEEFNSRRRTLAAFYARELAEFRDVLELPSELPGRKHTYHVYPVIVDEQRLGLSRAAFIERLREERIGASVHFIPLHRHPYYQATYGYHPASFPNAERLYRGLVSLPLYPKMTDADASDVVAAVRTIVGDARTRVAVPAAFAASSISTTELPHVQSNA